MNMKFLSFEESRHYCPLDALFCQLEIAIFSYKQFPVGIFLLALPHYSSCFLEMRNATFDRL